MTSSVFLSHNSVDKPFVRRLATDLDIQGIRCWLDEAEIKVGESLVEKIREGIDATTYVIVVLSPDSIKSPWVQREVDVAINQEIFGRKVKILPLLYRVCELPGFLLGKKYADFTDELRYDESLRDLVKSIGVVYRENVFGRDIVKNLGSAVEGAWAIGIPILSHPFHRPFQYMGLTIAAAEKATGGLSNAVGNIIIDNDDCHMLLEAEGNFISYVSVDLKRTAPQYQDRPFDPIPALGMLSINPAELEQADSSTRYHHFSDHRRKLKISVACLEDNGPLTVWFSGKYYGT